MSIDLERLVNSPDVNVRRTVTSYFSCPTHLLKKLADDDDYLIRDSIVTHPNTTTEVLEILLYNQKSGIRNIEHKIAGLNKSLSEDIYFHLCTNIDSFIRMNLAQNKQIPDKVLFFLANDDEPAVRAAVARNPNCPKILLQQLAKDEHYVVRLEVAYCYPSKDDIFVKLLNDPSYAVKISAAENIKIAFEYKLPLINDNCNLVRAAILKNEDCPIEILQQAANQENLTLPEVFALLENKRMMVSDYQRLLMIHNNIHSFDYKTMKSVAANPHTPEPILFSLSERIHDIEICENLLQNPKVPLKILLKFVKHHKEHLRKMALSHPSTPEPIKKLANLFSL